MSETSARVVPIEVLGQQFPIRSDLDARYIQALADYVNEKVRAAAVATPSSDSLRVAVVAALNIADEMFRAREAADAGPADIARRLEQIERILDRALGLDRPSMAPLDPQSPSV